MKGIVVIVLMLSLMLVTAGFAAAASTDPTDVLIKALVDKGIITKDDASVIRAEIAKTIQDEEAKKKSSSAKKASVKLSGNIQERFTHSPASGFNDTFETKRARLILSGDAATKVDFYIQTDLAGSRSGLTSASLSGTPAKLTTSSSLFGKPVLLDAIIGYKFTTTDKLSVGQQKIPFGLENLTSDAFLDTINRTQVNETLVPGRDNGSQGRDVGLVIGGTKGLNAEGKKQVEYELGLFNGAGINTTEDNGRKDIVGRVVWTPGIPGLSIGAAHYNGAVGPTHLQHLSTGGQLVYLNGPWTLKSEYIWAKDASTDKEGWYATLVRRLGSNTQGVVRYEKLNPNTSASNNQSWIWTYGFNWFLSKDGYTRFQVNYERHQEQGLQIANDQFLTQFQAGF